MALRRIWHDTFAGYANQSAFELAYPYDPPTDNSTSLTGGTGSIYATWGLTRGIGGGPGVENVSSAAVGSGKFATGFDKVALTPSCRYMAAELTYNFTGYDPAHPANANMIVMSVFSFEPGNRSGSFDGNLITISRNNTTGTLAITVRTDTGYGNLTGPPRQGDDVIGATSGTGDYTLRIYLKLSELTEGSPGVFAPSTDGFAKVYLNGSEIFSFTGPVWHGDSSVGTRTWNSVGIHWGGKIGTAFDIYDSDECSTSLPSDDSTPCCGDKTDSGGGGTTPGDVIGPDTSESLPAWTPDCDGGGTVPTAADITDDEDWTDPALVPCLRAHLEVERDAGDVTLLMSKRPLPDFDSFTEPRVLSYGTIRRSLSDDQGQPEMSTGSVTVSINDEDEPIRPALDENRSRFIRTTEAVIEILSEAGRAAVLDWRSLLRGRVEEPSLTIQRNGLQRSRQAVLPIVDAWAPFYDKVVNDARFLRSNFPNIDRALEGKCIPIVGGEHSDKGAVDVAGNNAEKGLVPGIYVGPWRTIDDDPLGSKPSVLPAPTGVAFTVNGTPGSRVLYYAVTQRNARGETTLSEIVQVDTAPTTLNGTDSVTIDFVPGDLASESIVYRGAYPTPSRRVKVLAAGLDTYTDTGVDPELPPGPPAVNTAYVPFDEGEFDYWGLIVIGRGPIHINTVFASNVDAGAAPKRININETAGVDMLCPGMPGWLYPTQTLRVGDDDLTCILMRGPRLQHHIDGIVTIAVNCCGMVDADGLSIQQAAPLLQHVLTQFVPTDRGEAWRNGDWLPLREFALGAPTLKPTDFTAWQDLSEDFLGNAVGYLGSIYLGLEPVTSRELQTSFDMTFDSFWRVNHHGQGSILLVNPYADPAAGSPYRERMEISRCGDPILDKSSVFKRIAYQYGYDPDAGKMRSEIEIFPAPVPGAETSADARDRGTEQCLWSSDATTVRDAKRRRYQRLKEPRWKQPVVTKFNGLEDDLGGQVIVTHRDAAGAGGWTNQPTYIEAHEVDLERKEVTLLCVDLKPLLDLYAGAVLGDGTGDADALLSFVMAE